MVGSKASFARLALLTVLVRIVDQTFQTHSCAGRSATSHLSPFCKYVVHTRVWHTYKCTCCCFYTRASLYIYTCEAVMPVQRSFYSKAAADSCTYVNVQCAMSNALQLKKCLSHSLTDNN